MTRDAEFQQAPGSELAFMGLESMSSMSLCSMLGFCMSMKVMAYFWEASAQRSLCRIALLRPIKYLPKVLTHCAFLVLSSK